MMPGNESIIFEPFWEVGNLEIQDQIGFTEPEKDIEALVAAIKDIPGREWFERFAAYRTPKAIPGNYLEPREEIFIVRNC